MTRCPFPFHDRPGVSLDADYLAAYRGEPLIPVTLKNGAEALLVTRYADVKTVLSDARFSRQAWKGGTLFARETSALALVTSDAPLHTRRRRAVQAAFTVSQAERDRPRIAQIAESLLDAIDAPAGRFDLIASYTQPFPYLVICEMLGLPKQDISRFLPWVETMMSAGRFTPEATAEAHRNMYDYFGSLLRDKQQRLARGEPHDGLLMRLLDAHQPRDDEENPDQPLSFEELTVLAFGMMMAGGETTTNHLALCVCEVLRDPALAARLQREPERIPDAVEELLRWTWFVMTGGQPHVALEDVALSCGTIRAGQVVIPLTDAANRDPAAFGDADTFRIDRTPNRHLGFGIGRHMCLGAPHARVELQEGLDALLRRFPRLELALPEAELPWRSGMFMRGIWQLPVQVLP
ncbi:MULTISPECIES: cytochrome P450 [unclassified Burkholderia]|uniref:cytochrome P450 n=1 Tax=unclassified Burkholderia TaxID=2613784 RepID=UPI001421DD96|nr:MULTISPECIES: cytochrome P450 [unclassified Burkholderia]NIE82522.1 cytochrome P450 [Burkholderia sp. Tr-860]NIF61299.1 cytochrome P450 [Burkholderia sp. Cy-647]NIF94504.1 cytochrome P450 [Burkholderia sp. Ax-1720]